MKCNNCDNEMTIGKSSISATALGFLFFGFSYKNLVFNGENESNRVVLGNDDTKTSYLCRNCGSVFIKNHIPSNPVKSGKYTYNVEEGDDLSKIVP